MSLCRKLRRKGLRLYAQMVREKAPSSYVARGWAIGMFYGCLIPFGFQLVLSVPTALFLKGSKMGATLGTLITNPVTIFIIYPAQCWVGCQLIGAPISWSYLSGDFYPTLAQVSVFNLASWVPLADFGYRIWCGFFAGGILLTAIMTPLTYWFVKRLVERRRTRHPHLTQKGA